MQNVNPILANALELLKQGNAELAEKEFAKAATACCKAFGETDIVTARTLAHLARVVATRGKVDMAVPMYRRVICIHEALPQPSNSDHAVALCELATLLEESGGSQEDAAGLLRRKADGIMGELSARKEAVAVKKDSAGSIDDDDDDEEESSDEDCDDGDDNDGNSSSGNSDGGPEVKAGVGGKSRGGEDSVQNPEQRDIDRDIE